jgi:hypothetical protein
MVGIMLLNFPLVKTGDRMFLMIFHFSPVSMVSMFMKYLLASGSASMGRRSTK